jgi:AcrR family transcriptional regulator
MTQHTDSRDQILAHAQRLFMEQGFRGISMRQIAEQVGLTKAALYYHFRDKEELFVAIVERYLHRIAELMDRAAAQGDTCREQLTAIVHAILTQPVEERAILRLASQELSNISPDARGRFLLLYHEKFIGRLAALLEAGMVSGELRRLDARLTTWTLLGMMYPYFHPSPSTGFQLGRAEIDALVSIYFDGLATKTAA